METVALALGSGLFWVGFFIGAIIGAAWMFAKISWRVYRTAKKGMPGLRKVAWTAMSKAALKIAGVVALAGLTLYLVVSTADPEPDATTPASVPSPTSTPGGD